jgi:predicted Zn-dependent protease with MMP-like domain
MAGMSMREFKELVRQVMTTLPPEIAAHAGNIVVDVDDWADDDLLREAGFTEEEIEDGETVLGLFEPMQLPSYDGLETKDRPDRLWIFKGPHEEEFRDQRRLRTEIRKTVIHELAHHFGFDEGDLERWDANPDPFREA